jgi:hypothetical protein
MQRQRSSMSQDIDGLYAGQTPRLLSSLTRIHLIQKIVVMGLAEGSCSVGSCIHVQWRQNGRGRSSHFMHV